MLCSLVIELQVCACKIELANIGDIAKGRTCITCCATSDHNGWTMKSEVLCKIIEVPSRLSPRKECGIRMQVHGFIH